MQVPARACRLALIALAILTGCKPQETIEPKPPEPSRLDEFALSEADDALIAALLADDPGDFHGDRARVWRIGEARWSADSPEFPGRPITATPTSLARPLELVVIDARGPRVILPLDQLEWQPPAGEIVSVSGVQSSTPSPEPLWKSLRLLAELQPADLIAGLRVELKPTPWLALAAGVPLRPLGREGDRLHVGWDDPQCGFGLSLAIAPEDFGPFYEEGPLSAELEPKAGPAKQLRLIPGAKLYGEAQSKEPLLRMHSDESGVDETSWVGQRISVEGKPVRGRQAITLRCRGVIVRGWVDARSLVEVPGRYAFVEQSEPPPVSSCEQAEGEPIELPRATVLHSPDRRTVIGVVTRDVQMIARPGSQGWWSSCVPSPWGDLELVFRLR